MICVNNISSSYMYVLRTLFNRGHYLANTYLVCTSRFKKCTQNTHITTMKIALWCGHS